MDMRRDMRRMDGRNPYGSRGGYVVSSRRRRGRRGDRGMDYAEHDMRMRDYGDMRGSDYAQTQMAHPDMHTNYRGYDMGDMARRYDMAGSEYADMSRDGHHRQAHGSTYYPIQAMGTFEGYYGMPEQDYGYNMRVRGGHRDYGYPMYEHDYGYDYGDYGETLSEQELEHWCKKLKAQLTEQEKQMFSKEMISQKAKAMGKKMEDFGEKELEVATLMVYTDYKNTIGQNPDIAIKLAYDWLTDKDVAVKGAEKLAVYYDCIVEGDEE